MDQSQIIANLWRIDKAESQQWSCFPLSMPYFYCGCFFVKCCNAEMARIFNKRTENQWSMLKWLLLQRFWPNSAVQIDMLFTQQTICTTRTCNELNWFVQWIIVFALTFSATSFFSNVCASIKICGEILFSARFVSFSQKWLRSQADFVIWTDALLGKFRLLIGQQFYWIYNFTSHEREQKEDIPADKLAALKRSIKKGTSDCAYLFI